MDRAVRDRRVAVVLRLLAGLAILSALALTACDLGDAPEQNQARSAEDSTDQDHAPSAKDSTGLPAGSPANLVSPEDVRRTPAGSPQRALLEWFQAVQFRDEGGVELLTVPTAYSEAGESRVDRAVEVVGSALGKPAIISVRLEGDRAVVRAAVQAFAEGTNTPVSTDPESFDMTKIARTWRLADLDYLLTAARAMRRGSS